MSQSGSGQKQLIRQILGDDSVFSFFPRRVSSETRPYLHSRNLEHARDPPRRRRRDSIESNRRKRERERTREMSTAVASAPAIGVRNGNLMHGQRLSHARRVAVGARPGRVAPRTMAFVPNLIPNPFHRWGACVIPTLSSDPRGWAPPTSSPASISWRSHISRQQSRSSRRTTPHLTIAPGR